MADVTRFPHYHQAENVVTNHVMVMLRMLYNASPHLLEALLRALCADEMTIGPRFSQQIAGAHSVPDGLILQEPLAVFIETKLTSKINLDQIQRHCKTIMERLPEKKGSFLISLTTGRAGEQSIPEEVQTMARENSVTIVPITFGELVTQITELRVADLPLKETLGEFTEFVIAQGLVPHDDQFMVAVLTGTSWRESLQYRVYYEPFDRNPKWRRATFLGLYHDKQVSHVGRILAAVAAMEDGEGGIAFDKPEMGTIDDACQQAIRNVINAAQRYYPHLQRSRHRFYIVDDFSQTDFRKATPGGMFGHRYFDIGEIGGKQLSARTSGAQAATILNGHTFR